jgi:uncharacterized membrane protein YwzB
MLQILVVIIAYLTFVCLQNGSEESIRHNVNKYTKRSKHMHALLCVVMFAICIQLRSLNDH